MQTTLAISGMASNLCRERVSAALERIAGVTDVSVSLIQARAEILHGPACEPDQLVQAVLREGYGAVRVTD